MGSLCWGDRGGVSASSAPDSGSFASSTGEDGGENCIPVSAYAGLGAGES